MSVLQEVIGGAASDEMSLSTLLRKTQILVSRIGSRPAVDWVDWELNGYPENAALPEYRILPLIIRANLRDIACRYDGWTVPPAFLGKDADAWIKHPYRDGIASLEHIVAAKEESLHFSMGNLVLFLKSRKFTEMQIDAAWGETSVGRVRQILDTVRNRVLKFALDLEKEYPNVEDKRLATSGENVPDRVTQIFNNNIYGPANVVGIANSSTISIVATGDADSLSKALMASGVTADDAEEVKRAVLAEPAPEQHRFGPRVTACIKKLIGKAADGTWQVGIEAAGSLLADALKRYYGLQ